MDKDRIDETDVEEMSDTEKLCHEIEYVREDLVEAVEKLAENEKNKQFFDKELGTTIKNALSSAIEKLGNVKPPIVNIDLKAIEKIAKSISDTNSQIIKSFLELSSKDDESKYHELLKSAIEVINKNNDFLKNGLHQFDYSSQLKGIWETLAKEKNVQKFTIERDNRNLIKEIIPVYKK